MSRDRDRIVAHLQRHKTFLDFTQDDLGEDLCKIATDGCLENIIGQVDPDGNPWDELSERYDGWKARKFPGRPPGVLHFVMAQPEEVAGVPSVAPDLARVEYGISDAAKQEAAWFQEGDAARNRPPRRFWGLSEAAKSQVVNRLDRRFKAIIRG